MPQPFLRFLLQSLPLARIAHPSRGRQLPCRYPRTRPAHPPATFTARFRPLPRLLALAWLPRTAMASLSAGRSRPPGPPGHRRPEPRVPPASPTSKPSSSCESVHDGSGCPSPPAAALLDFCPSEVLPPVSRILGPAPPRGGTPRPPRSADAATQRTLRPPTPGELSPGQNDSAQAARQIPAPFEAGPHRLSTASPTPSTLVTPGEPDDPWPSKPSSAREVACLRRDSLLL